MTKFFNSLGRVGNVALHAGMLGLQAYTLASQNGKVRWDNVAIAFIQLLTADQALKAQPPGTPPTQEPPKP